MILLATVRGTLQFMHVRHDGAAPAALMPTPTRANITDNSRSPRHHSARQTSIGASGHMPAAGADDDHRVLARMVRGEPLRRLRSVQRIGPQNQGLRRERTVEDTALAFLGDAGCLPVPGIGQAAAPPVRRGTRYPKRPPGRGSALAMPCRASVLPRGFRSLGVPGTNWRKLAHWGWAITGACR
jgi:hypothetical protein